jgi:hypothetical protein
MAIDAAGGTIRFDLVQWLTGEDAAEYIEAHPNKYPGLYEEYEQEGQFPYDYLVVNDNPRLRTLPYASGTNAKILYGDGDDFAIDQRTVPVADVGPYLAAHSWPLGSGEDVFWLTVVGGRITSLEEQFQS